MAKPSMTPIMLLVLVVLASIQVSTAIDGDITIWNLIPAEIQLSCKPDNVGQYGPWTTLTIGQTLKWNFFNRIPRGPSHTCVFQWGTQVQNFDVLPLQYPCMRCNWAVRRNGFYIYDLESKNPIQFVHPWQRSTD